MTKGGENLFIYPSEKKGYKLISGRTYFVPVKPVGGLQTVLLVEYASSKDGFITVRRSKNDGAHRQVPIASIDQSRPILKGPRTTIKKDTVHTLTTPGGESYELKYGTTYLLPLLGKKLLEVVYREVPSVKPKAGVFVSLNPHPRHRVYYTVTTDIDFSRPIQEKI